MDKCKSCGSDSLFSGFFDADDLGFPLDIDTPKEQVPEGVRYTTFCNDCGDEWLPKAQTLTAPQRRLLARVVEAGSLRQNGRGRSMVEALDRFGFITYDYTLDPHANGRYTEVFIISPTPLGRQEVA